MLNKQRAELLCKSSSNSSSSEKINKIECETQKHCTLLRCKSLYNSRAFIISSKHSWLRIIVRRIAAVQAFVMLSNFRCHLFGLNLWKCELESPSAIVRWRCTKWDTLQLNQFICLTLPNTLQSPLTSGWFLSFAKNPYQILDCASDNRSILSWEETVFVTHFASGLMIWIRSTQPLPHTKTSAQWN